MGTEQAIGVSDLGSRDKSIKKYTREENGEQSEQSGD